MPLFLFERKLLSYPSFYMSEYLEAHREEYYERLLGCRAMTTGRLVPLFPPSA